MLGSRKTLQENVGNQTIIQKVTCSTVQLHQHWELHVSLTRTINRLPSLGHFLGKGERKRWQYSQTIGNNNKDAQ